MTIYLSGVCSSAVAAYAETERSLGLMAQPRSAVLRWLPHFSTFAVDNGAYGAFRKGLPFDPAPWLRFLDTVPPGALFVVVPDVVADHGATVAAWETYSRHVIGRGHRAAFALQNGCTDLSQVPADAGAVFVGGTDDYKLGDDAARVCWQARAAGLWVHLARVNSSKRWLRALAMGADSADGTFLRFGNADDMLLRLAEWLRMGRAVGGQLSLIDRVGTEKL